MKNVVDCQEEDVQECNIVQYVGEPYAMIVNSILKKNIKCL